MTDEEYQIFLGLLLRLRTTESILAEAVEELRKANASLRDLAIKKL